jgi:hypothetical protein
MSKLTDDQINELFIQESRWIIQEENRKSLVSIYEDYKDKKIVNYSDSHSTYWSIVDKSKFIESFIINIPTPSIILWEKSLFCYEILDGRKRVETIYEFINNRFKFRGLDYWGCLNGRFYNDLPHTIKDRLNRAKLWTTTILIDRSLDVERINNLEQYIYQLYK